MKRKISLLLAMVLILSTLTNVAVAEDTVPASTETEAVETENKVLELSIDEAVKLAIESDRGMWKLDDKIKEMKDLRKKGSSDSEQAEYLIGLSLSDTSAMGITADGYLKLLLDKNNYSGKTAELKPKEIEKQREQLLVTLEIGTKSAYYGVLLAEKAIEINEGNLNKANEQLRVVNLKFNNGSATKAEVLSGEMAVQQAKTDYDSAIDDLNIAKLNFLNLLNLPFDTEFVLTETELSYVQTEEVKLDEAIEKAKEDRVEILTAENDLELQKIETHVYKAYYTSNLRQHKAAIEELKDAELNVPQAHKDVELDVRNKYLNLMKAERALLNADKTLEIANESARINKLLYENGMSTVLDVLNADEALAQAEIFRYTSLVNYNLEKLRFDYSNIGTIKLTSN
ncbi:MAG: TolC family protein [Sedimentibacter sp.]